MLCMLAASAGAQSKGGVEEKGECNRGAGILVDFRRLFARTAGPSYRSCVVVTAPVFVPYLSNHARRYNCVRRKFDGVLDVP